MTKTTPKNSNETRSRAEAQSKIEQASTYTKGGSVYDRITDRITAQLEKGTVPWRKPWNVALAFPRNLITRRAYRGINVFLLLAMNYESPYWLTFNQIKQLGGNVRKGEKACPVVFWKPAKIEDDETGEEKEIPFLRSYHVFNLNQCEAIKVDLVPENPGVPILTPADEIVSGMPNPPAIRYGMDRAFYQPSQDLVGMPNRKAFETDHEFFSTIYHELCHSTGHPSRLNRPTLTDGSGFGSDPYSKEELIAEMGAAFLCGHSGVLDRTLENSAAYVQGWLERLKNDKKLIVQAAAQAQKAADYILGIKPPEAPPPGAMEGGPSHE